MKFIAFVIMLLFNTVAMAQEATEIEMADQFRAEGKIYVVVAVVLLILFGLFFYLVRMDRKISKLEKEQKS